MVEPSESVAALTVAAKNNIFARWHARNRARRDNPVISKIVYHFNRTICGQSVEVSYRSATRYTNLDIIACGFSGIVLLVPCLLYRIGHLGWYGEWVRGDLSAK